MKAYVIALVNVRDQGLYDRYRAKVMATVEAFGGRFLVRAGHLTTLEGNWPYQRTIVLEFPSRERAEGWYRSPGYQDVLPPRRKASEGNLIIIDGVE